MGSLSNAQMNIVKNDLITSETSSTSLSQGRNDLLTWWIRP
ncbi:unnamed protein product [Haemonchus placei]|uniref:Uncharacterized protein n=1 Tax=Haemonchus placei TaxID=6290 RepID=A0A0N4WIE6_HAEPC|nr:unnamed protein product [Haemonchus placei]